jgi:proteasome alpha subunit
MAYTPYDWTQNLQHRQDYVQDRLREGSPVAGLTYGGGALLLTLRRGQEKIFEIYDRLMFSGVGHQADLESLRLAAIDFAHREGFARSPEDVTAQRVMGVALSPLLKRSFGDFFSHPLVAKALFAELGERPEEDAFYTLDFDGEFSLLRGAAAVAGSRKAEEEMLAHIHAEPSSLDLAKAVRAALEAWAIGRQRSLLKEETEEEAGSSAKPAEVLKSELKEGAVEAAVLERAVDRDNKFRHLSEEEIKPALEEALGG